MRTRELWLWVMLLLCVEYASGAVGTWRNYTSMKEVRDVTHTGDTFWAATSGGLFSWRENSSTFDLYTNAEGLRNNDLTAVGVDRNGNIWTGTSTGVIHIYSPSTGSWQYVLNIADSDQTNKRINRFVMHGDTVLICTDFGLSVFLLQRFQFGDTYTKFGSLPTNTRVAVRSAAIFNGSLWAAISAGTSANYVAVASLSNPNILPPESWALQTVSNNTVQNNTLSIFNGTLYAGTGDGLYYSNGTAWVGVNALAGKNIVGTASAPAHLVICAFSLETFTLDGQGITLQYGSVLPFRPTSITFNSSDDLIVGSENGGILSYASSWQSFVPNGPNANQFISLAVDDDGVLWGASGYAGNGKGFYRLRGLGWKSFTVESTGLPTNDYFRVSIGCGGSLWASSWGRGVVEIPRGLDTVDASHIFGKNVGMIGIPTDTNYIVVSSVQCDTRGNHWMNIIRAINRNILVVRKADGTWLNMPLKYGANRLTTLLENPPVERSVAVDASGNVWFASQDPTYKGLISLGNHGEVDDSVAYYLTDANGLPGNDIRAVIVDRDNDVWVGTDRGIAIILDPDRPTRTGSIASYRPLNGIAINTIAIDPLNQKWVGTNEGAILLSPDGTQQLASYTVEGTGGRLIDNDIKSIAIDSKRGIVYFGTSNGLASLTTAGVAPKQAFDELLISPNPYIVPNVVPLTIDGLVENSTLKVLSVDGRLVRTIFTPGGRIGFWDGKDEEGNESSSGVYIVVAYSEDGSKVATGKVALVRR